MPRPRRPELPPTGLLDWSANSHWRERPRPCRYCRADTHLRDSHGDPAHKVCAEHAIHEQAAEASAAYENERLPPS